MTDLDGRIREKLCRHIDQDYMAPALGVREAALLAVLNLHKPVRQGIGAKTWQNCAHCQNANWGGPEVDWPCETVEAIAEALGVRVNE